MGTTADAYRRHQTRFDTDRIRNYINTARKWIFERGFSPESAAVERLLEPLSLVPVQVCLLHLKYLRNLRIHPSLSERVFHSTIKIRLQPLLDVCARLAARV